MRELLLALRNHDGKKGREPNRVPGVHFRWMAETAAWYCGPNFRPSQYFRVQGFEMYNDIKPSPFELATTEKTTWPDLVPRVLWIEWLSSIPAHDVGAIHYAILGATSLSVISRQPLIYLYGWIKTVDTIILPARLILILNMTSSMHYDWVLLVQPANLDIPMPKTINFANRDHGRSSQGWGTSLVSSPTYNPSTSESTGKSELFAAFHRKLCRNHKGLYALTEERHSFSLGWSFSTLFWSVEMHPHVCFSTSATQL